MRALLGLKFFLVAMLIFVLSTFMAAFHGCKNGELDYLRFNPKARSFFWGYQSKESNHVSILNMEVDDGSLEGYLQSSALAVRDLKRAGAKVVVVPVPEEMRFSKENQNLIERIQASGDVIFASHPETERLPFLIPMTRRNIDSWWVEHAFVHRINITWAPSTLNLIAEQPALNEFIPFGIRETHGKDFLPDIALEALKRYLSGNDSSSIWRDADGVGVGKYRIMTWGDGVAYTKTSWHPDWSKESTANWKKSTGITYETNLRNDKVTRDSALTVYKNKIVILQWFYVTAAPIWPSYAARYWQIIDSILSGSIVERHDEWDVAFIAFFVAFSALVFFKFRSILAIFMTLVTVGLLVYASFWLFNSHDVLFDPLYILLAILTSTLIFPVVKLAHEKSALKEELKSLEAEKKRIEEELKQKQSNPGA